MTLDIAMRPTVSTTTASPQPSQDMSDGVSFADELALMSGAIPTERSGTALNPAMAQVADGAADVPGRADESRESVPTKSSQMSMTKYPDEGLLLGSRSEEVSASGRGGIVKESPKLMDGLSRSRSSDSPLMLKQFSSPALQVPRAGDTWDPPMTKGSLVLAGRGGDVSRPSRGDDVGLLSPPPARRAISYRVGAEAHDSRPGQKPFTERLTELSMMVAELRYDESSGRSPASWSGGSGVDPHVDADQPTVPGMYMSMDGGWSASPPDELKYAASYKADDQGYSFSGVSNALDVSMLELTYSMMPSLTPNPPVTQSNDLERANHIAEPLRMTVEHLRSLLPEGGRLLQVQPHLVRLEVVHPSGPLQLEVVMRSGVVDVRAQGVGAAEMAWRVPELAAALHGTGMRLGTFDIQPARRGRESSSSDRGHTDHRQDLDDTAEETVQNVSTAGRRALR